MFGAKVYAQTYPEYGSVNMHVLILNFVGLPVG